MDKRPLALVGVLILLFTAGCVAPSQPSTPTSEARATSAVPTTDGLESTASITVESETDTTIRVFLAHVEPNTTAADEYGSDVTVANETYSLSAGDRISLGEFLERGQQYYFELYVDGERAYDTRVLTWEVWEFIIQENGEVEVFIN